MIIVAKISDGYLVNVSEHELAMLTGHQNTYSSEFRQLKIVEGAQNDP